MATLVLTVIGDDKLGLVDALSGVIADNGGNWERSQMAELAGKFAGIVLVSVPEQNVDTLVAALSPLEAQGLLDITAEVADDDHTEPPSSRLSLELLGTDHPGIVHDIAHALAEHDVSIEDLSTNTRDAPMAGGTLFEAKATLVAPAGVSFADLRAVLEDLANELMVDIDLHAD